MDWSISYSEDYLTSPRKYWAAEFDENMNCLRKSEMDQLKIDSPDKCTEAPRTG